MSDTTVKQRILARLLCLAHRHDWHAYTKAGHRWRFCRRPGCGYFDCRRG